MCLFLCVSLALLFDGPLFYAPAITMMSGVCDEYNIICHVYTTIQ